MSCKPLNITQSTYTKNNSTTIFNFPLNKPGRNQLEELATIWGLSMAATIRRSIDLAMNTAKENDETSQNTELQSKVSILETLLAMHADLSVIKNNTDKLLTATEKDKASSRTND